MGHLVKEDRAFFEEHRRCDELDGGVQDGRLWMVCECGARLTKALKG